MNLEVMQAFSAHLTEKRASDFISATKKRIGDFGRAAVDDIKKAPGQVMRDTRDLLDPRRTAGAVREGLHNISNMSPEALKTMRERVSRGGFVNDMAGPGMANSMRRAGVLSNVPKYVGSSPMKRGLNRVARAMPGRAVLPVAMEVGFAGDRLLRKKDALTGREMGKAERALGAVGGLTAGLISQRSGMVGSIGTSLVGDAIGARVGRTVDNVAARVKNRAKGKKPTQAEAIKKRG